jgi:hypothetical protein
MIPADPPLPIPEPPVPLPDPPVPPIPPIPDRQYPKDLEDGSGICASEAGLYSEWHDEPPENGGTIRIRDVKSGSGNSYFRLVLPSAILFRVAMSAMLS